jgi:hypothetical protein
LEGTFFLCKRWGQLKNNEPTTSVGISLLKMPSLFLFLSLFLFFPHDTQRVSSGYYQGIMRKRSFLFFARWFMPENTLTAGHSQNKLPWAPPGGLLISGKPHYWGVKPYTKRKVKKWRTSVWVWY